MKAGKIVLVLSQSMIWSEVGWFGSGSPIVIVFDKKENVFNFLREGRVKEKILLFFVFLFIFNGVVQFDNWPNRRGLIEALDLRV